MLAFFSITKGAWVGIGIGIFALIVIVAALIVNYRTKKKNKQQTTGVIEERKERFSTTEETTKLDDSPNAGYVKGDIIASRNVTLVAGRDLKIGKYTVLTSDGSEKFNIRVNGLVREFCHEDVLVLGEGDTVCPVSHTVILR